MSDSILPKLQLAGFWQRVVIEVLDMIILLPALWINTFVFQKIGIERHTFIPTLLWYAGIILGLSFILHVWGGTPGCLILRFRIVNDKGDFLAFSKAVLRYFDKIISFGLSIILLYFLTANLPDSPLFLDSTGIDILSELYGGKWYTAKQVWLLFYVINILVIPLNQYSRSLTDFAASSYVASFDIKAREKKEHHTGR
jgi:uncharacterized RDD family membrane protein YckC